jgi:hypothetical protein
MAKSSTAPPLPQVPPLEPGDRLTRDEFERRYEAMPELKKAELIEGVVFMPSAVRWNHHANPHANLITWLGVFSAFTPGVLVGDNGSLRLDTQNEPQPDAAMIIDPACGGKVRLSPDDYIEGGPELVAEIAASSVSIDLNTKLTVYQRNDVREYIVWRVRDRAVDWFVQQHGQFVPLTLGQNGYYQSPVFPGLWLDPAALVRSDSATVLQVLQQGLASPEHTAFVARLQKTSGNS